MKDLPQGYRPIRTVSVTNGKGMALLSLVLIVGMTGLGFYLAPKNVRHLEGPQVLAYLVTLLAGGVLYLFLHELIHGVLMRAYSGARVRYSFRAAAASAGCEGYFTKRQYIWVALAPLVLLGGLLALLNRLLYPAHFWYFFILQILNVSGAAGDVYSTGRMLRMPRETMVQDTGTHLIFYSCR